MRLMAGLMVTLSLVPAFANGESAPLNKRLGTARNVALGFDTGAEFVMGPEFLVTHPVGHMDYRTALNDLREEIERWGRYWIVTDRKDAELLIAIGVHGAVTATDRSLIGTPERRHGIAFANATPKSDVLTVYDAQYSQRGVPLWSGHSVRGLSGDPPPLVDRFREDVERAAKQR